MSRHVRFLPHRVAAFDAVEWGPWSVDDDGERIEVGAWSAPWDYASTVTVNSSVRIDWRGVLEPAGLSSMRQVMLVSIADCAATGQRLVNRQPFEMAAGFVTRETVEVGLELPGALFAGRITLSSHLVVMSPPAHHFDPTVSSSPGSRLCGSPESHLDLDSSSSLFPTEIVEFDDLALPDVPWLVHVTGDDPDDSFMGSVTLLINEGHPAGRAVNDHSHPERRMLMELLRVDLLREILGHATAVIDAVDRQRNGYSFDSLGAHATSLSRLYLGLELVDARDLYREQPAEFERTLRARTRFLANVDELQAVS